MYTVKLMNEYIYCHGNKGIKIDSLLIDTDDVLQSLNEQVAILFDSFYDFDVGDQQPYFF
jgi:hypothetical protein